MIFKMNFNNLLVKISDFLQAIPLVRMIIHLFNYEELNNDVKIILKSFIFPWKSADIFACYSWKF